MKKITAFFLAIIYLAFTTGMVWTMSHSGDYAYLNVVAGRQSANEESEKAFDKYTGGIQLTKAPKHLAAVGKVKVPRPGSGPVTSGGFISFGGTGKIVQKETLPTPVIFPSSLFIKNCVFLI